MKAKARPRVVCLCILRKDSSILVAEGHDRVRQETFYRPLGGGLEFGEYGAKAVRRELREEIDVQIVNVRFVGTLESIYTYQGKRCHDIVLVYEAEFQDKSLYHTDIFEASEEAPERGWGGEQGRAFRAIWMPLSTFRKKRAILYPTGLLGMLPG